MTKDIERAYLRVNKYILEILFQSVYVKMSVPFHISARTTNEVRKPTFVPVSVNSVRTWSGMDMGFRVADWLTGWHS